MKHHILIVDDERQLLSALAEGLKTYDDSLRVLTAVDGRSAAKILRQQAISLIVADVKLPELEGLGLLQYASESFPDIPVIVTTAYDTPEMKRLAAKAGAAGYVTKPFKTQRLARKISAAMRRESDGGTLHHVSSTIFLQLIEMEQKTCTIRLQDDLSARKGVLFFRDGELRDARTGALRGKPAALRILTWDKARISIQNSCPEIEDRIQSELHTLVLEAARLKDEDAPPGGNAGQLKGDAAETDGEAPRLSDPVSRIRCALENHIGQSDGIEDIYLDSTWDGFVRRLSTLGDLFGAGPMKICFVDRGHPSDHIIIPGPETTVIAVKSKTPPDKIMRALSA